MIKLNNAIYRQSTETERFIINITYIFYLADNIICLARLQGVGGGYPINPTTHDILPRLQYHPSWMFFITWQRHQITSLFST